MSEKQQLLQSSKDSKVDIPEELTDKLIESKKSSEEQTDNTDSTEYKEKFESQKAPEVLEYTHQYVRDLIVFADQKAAFVFTLSSALLIFLYEKSILMIWYKNVCLWTWQSYFAFLSTVFLIAAIFLSILTVWPRLKGSAKGIIYWKGILNYKNSQSYMNYIRTLSTNNLMDELGAHLFEISKISKSKYLWVTLGIWSLSIGLGLSIILIIFKQI